MEKPQAANPPKWGLWAILTPFLCLLPLNTASAILRDEVLPFGPSRPSLESSWEEILLFITFYFAARRYFSKISLKNCILGEIILTFIVLMFEVSIRSCKNIAFCKSLHVKEIASICFTIYNFLYQMLEIRYQIHLHKASSKSDHGVGFLYANAIALRIIPHVLTQVVPNADYRESFKVLLSAYVWLVVGLIISIIAFYYIESDIPKEILISNLIEEKEEEESVEKEKSAEEIKDEKYIEKEEEEKLIEKQEEGEKSIEEKKEENDENNDIKKYLAWFIILLFCGMNYPKLNALEIVQYARWIPRYNARNPWGIDWKVLFLYLGFGWAFLVSRAGKLIEKYDKNMILRYVVMLAVSVTVLNYLSLIFENVQLEILTLCGLWGLNDLILLIVLTKISTEFDGDYSLFAGCNLLFYLGGFFKSMITCDNIHWKICFYCLLQIPFVSQFFKSPLSKIGKVKL